jgi:hypothetical protein
MTWSTARKNMERDRAAQGERVQVRDLQNFVTGFWNPAATAGAVVVLASVAVGWVQNLPL